jgi:hypothetical protein
VEKLIDHGYMDLGYLCFMNDVRMKSESRCPNQGRHGFLCWEKKAIKGDDKMLSKCWKQRIFTITK